jgi:hypothetical protein
MTTLVLKLALTPVLIIGASLAGRRFGGAVSGWLVGLPLTSAPIVAFLAVEQGPRFAATAAVGSLSGAAAEGAFCLAYARLAQPGSVPALMAGTLAFAALGGAAVALSWSSLPLFVAALIAFAVALLTMPRSGSVPVNATPPARWDLPARAIVATALVLLLTGVATAIGARLTGLPAVYPVYAAVLTVFAHSSCSRRCSERSTPRQPSYARPRQQSSCRRCPTSTAPRERVCREGGGRVLADRPADHTAAERVEHDGAVHLALTGRMVRDAEVHPEASRRRG